MKERASDVGERGGGDEAHSERARQVVVLAVALVAEVKGVLLLPLVGVAEQDHLTQEGVHNHVPIVDLHARGGGGGGRQGERGRRSKMSREETEILGGTDFSNNRKVKKGTNIFCTKDKSRLIKD